MKRIFFSIFFAVFALFLITPSFNKADALFCNPLQIALNYGCACVLDVQCASGYCHWPTDLPIGACSVRPRAPTPPPGTPAGNNPISLQRVRFPIPEPPCVDLSTGLCNAVHTSLGVIEVEPGKFIARLFGIMLAASGSIALLLIMRSGYAIMSARGNPEGIQKGREQLVSAIIGLMFLVFSFVLLQVISVDLLKIPGIGGSSSSQTHTCSDAGGNCRSAVTCVQGGNANLGRLDCSGSSEVVCCKMQRSCAALGGFCTVSGICGVDGETRRGQQDCPTGEICCVP